MTVALRTAGIVTAVVAAAGCGSTSSSSPSPSPSASAEAASPSATVAPSGPATPLSLVAMNISFQPTAFSVPPNAAITITIQNKDTSPPIKHNFTATGGATADQDLDPGSTHTVTLAAPASGTISFHCEYHPTRMLGTITVVTAAPAVAPPAAAPPAAAPPAAAPPAAATAPPVVVTPAPVMHHPVPTKAPTNNYGY